MYTNTLFRDITFTNNIIAGVKPIYLQADPDVYYNNLVYYSAQPPDRVTVIPNKYDPNLATVVIFNTSGRDYVDVTLPFSGDVFLKNVQDYWNAEKWLDLDVIDGRGTVNMKASRHTVEKPPDFTTPASTFPYFGVFIAEKKQPTICKLFLPLVSK